MKITENNYKKEIVSVFAGLQNSLNCKILSVSLFGLIYKEKDYENNRK